MFRKLLIGLMVSLTPVAAVQAQIFGGENQETLSSPQADRGGKIYVAVSGGYTILGDSEVDEFNGFSLPSNTLPLDNSFAVHAAVGTYVSPFRLETEFSYAPYDVSDRSVAGVSNSDISADVFSLMFNGYYDLPVEGTNGAVNLYIGGGVGPRWYSGDSNVTITPAAGRFLGTSQRRFSDSGSDVVFAYQGMAGVAVWLTDQMAVNVGYRVTSSSDPEIGGATFGAPVEQSVEAGLRFTF